MESCFFVSLPSDWTIRFRRRLTLSLCFPIFCFVVAHVTRHAQDLKVVWGIVVMIAVDVMDPQIVLNATPVARNFIDSFPVRAPMLPALPQIVIFTADLADPLFNHSIWLRFALPIRQRRLFREANLLGFAVCPHLYAKPPKKTHYCHWLDIVFFGNFTARQTRIVFRNNNVIRW